MSTHSNTTPASSSSSSSANNNNNNNNNSSSSSSSSNTTTTIEERLAGNDPTLVKLDLSSSLGQITDFQQFVESMKHNTNVSKVVIDFQWLEEYFSPNDDDDDEDEDEDEASSSSFKRKQILETIGRFMVSNNVEKIMIFDHGRQIIDMGSLTSVMMSSMSTPPMSLSSQPAPSNTSSNNLKALDVVRLEFSSRNDVEIFANAIRNQHSLERFSSHRLTLAASTAITSEGGKDDDDDDDGNDNVVTLDPLFTSLAVLPNLKAVCLSFDWDLRTSYVKEPKSLVTLLERSSSLQELKLWSRQLDDNCCVAIAKALRTNTTLKALDLQCQIIGNTGLEEITKMMEQNYTITTARTTSRRLSLSEKIDLYVRLNRAGRIVLVNEEATRYDWVNVLIEGRDDIDILFYTLHCNPTMLFC